MDRKGIVVVFVCLGLMMLIQLSAPKPLPRHAATASTVPAASVAPVSSPATGGTATALIPSPSPATAEAGTPILPAESTAPQPERLTQVQNGPLRVTFTSRGAALKEIELLGYQEENKGGAVVLNEASHSNVLALDGWLGADSAAFQPTLSPEGVSYSATLGNGVRWTRSYVVGGDYTIQAVDQLTNPGAAPVTLPAFSLATGRAQPARVAGHYQTISNRYLGIGWFSERFQLMTVDYFNPTWFSHGARDAFSSTEIDSPTPSLGHRVKSFFFVSAAAPAPTPSGLPPIKWISAENQFFAVLVTPEPAHPMDHATFQAFNTRDEKGAIPPEDEPDLEAAGFYPAVTLAPGQSTTFRYQLYTGPKEYWRLNRLGAGQQELMNYGMFEPVVVVMLRALHFFHRYVGNYGLAIILLTLVIKACTWPLQSMANRSGKRMQALAPKIKEVQAKYKDQPEKVGGETMALYRDYGVNPLAGCLPALVQMPVFLSLVYMLQNAVELRHQSFLWVHDLTQPDTVASWTLAGSIFGISHIMINPLPLMVTGLTMVMMRMTPQIGDPQQAKVAQFMPLIFLFIFYNFAAALSLYYVINNCVSIVQIYRNLKKPMPELKRVEKKS